MAMAANKYSSKTKNVTCGHCNKTMLLQNQVLEEGNEIGTMAFYKTIYTKLDKLWSRRKWKNFYKNSKPSVKIPNYGQLALVYVMAADHGLYIFFLLTLLLVLNLNIDNDRQ